MRVVCCLCVCVCVCGWICVDGCGGWVRVCNISRSFSLYLWQEEDAELAAIKASATEGSIVIGTSSNKTEKEHWILVMPERTLLPYPNPDVPMVVSQACDAVIAHSGSRIQVGAPLEPFPPPTRSSHDHLRL
jgi:hypothetical protein